MSDQTSNGVSYGYTRIEPIHDPMCPVLGLPERLRSTLWVESVCRCELIARVEARARADERERIAQALARIVVNSGCVARCDPTPVWPLGWADADGVFPSDLTEALPELDAAIARGGDR